MFDFFNAFWTTLINPHGGAISMGPDFAGFLFGVTGSALLMINHPRFSKWGWVLYVCSNFAWIYFSVVNQQTWYLRQTVFFTVTSIFGIWRWIVSPVLKNLRFRSERGASC